MDYSLENLGHEKFQEFCQALLLKDFPNLQCFPVGQRDGGRDAISFFPRGAKKDFLVFQVKYARKPLAETEPHKWLVKTIEGEMPRIKELIARGAKKYFLLTNIPGTAFSDFGSIDKVQKILSEMIDIPAECWWREDINRRLDGEWDIKWSYPEILHGQDVLRFVIENGLSEDKRRREAAILGFLQAQYDLDSEVKFKQIDLQSKLLDLFVDVPINIRPTDTNEGQKSFYLYRTLLEGHLVDGAWLESPVLGIENEFDALMSRRAVFNHGEERFIGASSLLLSSVFPQFIPMIVLEGAPGQGKSTITQYICQVNRMRLLAEMEEVNSIPKQHRAGSIRLPFRVDLRDLATWLGGEDPFSIDDKQNNPIGWHKSLEGFLAFLVKHFSGGTEFSVADLHAVVKLSATLIVLDGLDEVADISMRRVVVDEITSGVRRLNRIAASLQVVITSRPAAFANSPGFQEKSFPHFELTSLPRKLIDEYSDKWMKARKIRDREKVDIKRILKNKLDQPHLRDLARNPMQLSILLSLIHNHGSSLPDQRTALYDHYISLFFSRESDKNPIVQKHRTLLIGIHRYLAWLLHSEAETGNSRGNIDEERLKFVVKEYLVKEDKDPSLADEIFNSMVERVVALVSRVQGTYEFEVQPLREYFAARYLYETAPYSPPGGRRSGTKPDRFDAISRNFYWLNVSRFYAGCFSVGELSSLVDRLQELANEDDYKYTSHPRILAAMLLSDWVFEQHAKSRKQVVSLILDGLGLRYVLSANSQHQASVAPLILPKEYGGAELIDRCFAILREHPAPDYAIEVVELVRANAKQDEIKASWLKEIEQTSEDNRTKWIEYGLYMGLLSDLDAKSIEVFLREAPQDDTRLSVAFRSKHQSLCESSKERFESTLKAIFSRDIVPGPQQKSSSVLCSFAQCLNPLRYATAFRSPDPTPLIHNWLRNVYRMEAGDQGQEQSIDKRPWLARCFVSIEVATQEIQRTGKEWSSQLSPWERLVETTRTNFGDSWLLYHFANIAAGIKSNTEKYREADDLFDKTQPLCQRARHARLRVSAVDWWKTQFSMIRDDEDNMFFLLVLLTWGSLSTITSLLDVLETSIVNLSTSNWHRVATSLRDSTAVSQSNMGNASLDLNVHMLPEYVSERLAVCLGLRVNDEAASNICSKWLNDYQGYDIDILDFLQKSAFTFMQKEKSKWEYYLSVISKSYARGVSPYSYPIRVLFPSSDALELPIDIARQIAEAPEIYPRYLVRYAEMKCREALASKIVAVGTIAQNEKWFDE